METIIEAEEMSALIRFLSENVYEAWLEYNLEKHEDRQSFALSIMDNIDPIKKSYKVFVQQVQSTDKCNDKIAYHEMEKVFIHMFLIDYIKRSKYKPKKPLKKGTRAYNKANRDPKIRSDNQIYKAKKTKNRIEKLSDQYCLGDRAIKEIIRKRSIPLKELVEGDEYLNKQK